MSLACLACHSANSPTHSFRSHSVSSSDGESRCAIVVSYFTRKVTVPSRVVNSTGTSKVNPTPIMASDQGIPETPRLVRSRAVTRDLVRDWNFDEFLVEVREH